MAERLSVSELEGRLRAIDDRVRLVSPRVLRRLRKHLSQRAGLGHRVTHSGSLALKRNQALAVADPAELGFETAAALPETVLLLERPSVAELSAEPADVVLNRYWRILFHALVHARARNSDRGPIGLCLGEDERAESRDVLARDGWLMGSGEAEFAEEFAAVFLELRHFDAQSVRIWFPGVADVEGVAKTLDRALESDRLVSKSRPAGCGHTPLPSRMAIADAPEPEPSPVVSESRSERVFARLMVRADRARGRGNVVRAALLRMRASRRVNAARAGQAKAGARSDIEALARRLAAALGIGASAESNWKQAIVPLLDAGSVGFWSAEARLLFDLQRVCTDHERASASVDVVEWALSLGKRSIVRQLPNHREVLICRHLRRARARLIRARMAVSDRKRLGAMIEAEVAAAEGRLRERFRPLIERSLAKATLVASNLPEQVSIKKLVEEILDLVVERGYVRAGDLRDALARGDVKLPDLAGPGEFWSGDRLMLADSRLAISLDGVYHRAEVYQRTLQRFSMLAFGTAVGRWLTHFVAIPYGLALALLIVIDEISKLVEKLTGSAATAGASVAAASGHKAHELPNPILIFAIGTVILALLRSRPFRVWVFAGAKRLGLLAKRVFWDAPRSFLSQPKVKAIIASRPVQVAWAWGIEPMIAALAVALVVRFVASNWHIARIGGAVAFATSALFINSRLGRVVEESFAEWVSRIWHELSTDLIPGILRLVRDLFDQLLEALDRVLYAVDEWLRFRSGEGRLTFAAKAVLGVFWWVVTYVVRFCVNLLIEPQINPIKHFPTVTVAHKMIAPFIVFQFPLILQHPAIGMSKDQALSVALLTQFLLPGVFGFIIWELKENWRLYAANRPSTLRPVVIGGHGETMARLLRRGIHSGTVPKLYDRLRAATRYGNASGERVLRKQKLQLHHIEESLQQFVDREFLTLLHTSGALGNDELTLGEVRVATNRISIELLEPRHSTPAMSVLFVEREGVLRVRIEAAKSQGSLRERSLALNAALAGLADKAGADDHESRCSAFASRPIAWSSWVAFWESEASDRCSLDPVGSERARSDGNSV